MEEKVLRQAERAGASVQRCASHIRNKEVETFSKNIWISKGDVKQQRPKKWRVPA